MDENISYRAEKLYRLLKLDNIPISPKDKDRRYRVRSETKRIAASSKNGWERVKNTSESDIYFEQILILAQETGFFSVWMEIFRDDEVVKEGLAAAFKGTKKEYVLG